MVIIKNIESRINMGHSEQNKCGVQQNKESGINVDINKTKKAKKINKKMWGSTKQRKQNKCGAQ